MSSREANPLNVVAVLVVLMGLGVVVVDASLLNLALPVIAAQMNASASHAIWVVNAYQLATLVSLLPFANLGDRLGYRRVYMWGPVLYLSGAVIALLSQNLGMLVLARALQGLGAGAMMSVNIALVRQIYPPEQIGKGLGINGMVVAMSSVAGPAIAALVLGVANWRWLFIISLPLALTVFFVGKRVLPSNPPGRKHGPLYKRDVLLNVLMFALMFVGADLLAVTHASGGINWQTWGLVMIGAAVCVGFFYMRRQTKLESPLFPVDLMSMPIFAYSMAASVCAFTAVSLGTVSMPFLLQAGLDRTPFQAGLLLMSWPAATAIAAPFGGRLIGKVNSGVLGGVGMVLMACGLLALTQMPAAPEDVDIVWRLALAGAGFGVFQAPNNHTIATSPPPHRTGVGSGMQGTARLTGLTLGAVLVAQIFAKWPPGQNHGSSIAMTVGVGAALLSALCCVARELSVKVKSA